MKKLSYFFLLSLALLTVSGCCKCKKSKKHKTPSIVQVPVPALGPIPLEKVHCENLSYIRTYLAEFPKEVYSISYVKDQGHFYLDPLNDCIKNALRAGHAWEGDLSLLMKQKIPLGSTVIDVGAHVGTHTLGFSKAVGYLGRVIAFEPQPKLFRELVMNMTLNGATNIEFYWAGAGNSNGQIELSPMPETNEGGIGLWGGSGKFVDLLTLDSLQLGNVSLIKIDVEGMENSVLDGAKQLILKNRPTIFIEIFGGVDLQRANPEQRQVIQTTIEKLQALNYQVFHLETHNYLATPR